MRPKRVKITVQLEEQLVLRARREAARRGMNISELLEGFVKERMVTDREYETAMRRALARKPFLNTSTL